MQRLFDCYAKLELAFPDQDILSLLSRPEEFTRLTSTEARSLQVESIINALDLMYFWLYQPCAPVSYTHLDVYKRQRLNRQHPAPARPFLRNFTENRSLGSGMIRKETQVSRGRRTRSTRAALSLIHIS